MHLCGDSTEDASWNVDVSTLFEMWFNCGDPPPTTDHRPPTYYMVILRKYFHYNLLIELILCIIIGWHLLFVIVPQSTLYHNIHRAKTPSKINNKWNQRSKCAEIYLIECLAIIIISIDHWSINRFSGHTTVDGDVMGLSNGETFTIFKCNVESPCGDVQTLRTDTHSHDTKRTTFTCRARRHCSMVHSVRG